MFEELEGSVCLCNVWDGGSGEELTRNISGGSDELLDSRTVDEDVAHVFEFMRIFWDWEN